LKMIRDHGPGFRRIAFQLLRIAPRLPGTGQAAYICIRDCHGRKLLMSK
jgi:hypothetical protein